MVSLALHTLSLLLLPAIVRPPAIPPTRDKRSQDLELTLVENPDNLLPPERPQFLSRAESRAAGRLFPRSGLTPPPVGGDPTGSRMAEPADGAALDAAPASFRRTPEGLRLAPDIAFDAERAFRMELDGPPALDTRRYEHADYFLRMAAKISRRWHDAIPLTAHSMGLIPTGEVRILLLVGRDGTLLDHRVERDFHYPSMTRAAVYAVTAAAPYEPLPADIPDEAIVIPVIFRYIGR